MTSLLDHSWFWDVATFSRRAVTPSPFLEIIRLARRCLRHERCNWRAIDLASSLFRLAMTSLTASLAIRLFDPRLAPSRIAWIRNILASSVSESFGVRLISLPMIGWKHTSSAESLSKCLSRSGLHRAR